LGSGLVFAAAAVCGWTGGAEAQSTWNVSSGDWNVASNWLGGLPTGAASINSGTANLPVGVTGTSYVLFTGSAAGGSGTIMVSGGSLGGVNAYLGYGAGGSGSLVITGGTASINSLGSLNIGYGGEGSLSLQGGYLASGTTNIGYSAGSSGTATVSSGTWAASGSLFVGRLGTGVLVVEGGTMSGFFQFQIGYSPGGSGTATITGGSVAASFGYIGSSGIGTMNVNGGTAAMSGAVFMGLGAASSGTLTATSGKFSSGNTLNVGYSGTGHMEVNGATVSGSSVIVGTNSTAIASVSVMSGTLSATNALTVGAAASGATLSVSGSGSVASASGLIGSGASTGAALGSGNSVTVSDDTAVWVLTDNLTVGDYGSNNTLTIENEGLVKVGDTLGETISFSLHGSTGNALRLDGGYLALFGDQTSYVTDTLLTAGRIQYWDGAAWETATAGDLSIQFYTPDATGESEALADTGRSGLGGYTVVTSVPEPGIGALLAVAAGVGWVMRRRSSALRPRGPGRNPQRKRI